MSQHPSYPCKLVNSLNVIKESLGTKNLAILYLGAPMAESIGLKGGQISVTALCTLHSP